jgi:hypothetical protein
MNRAVKDNFPARSHGVVWSQEQHLNTLVNLSGHVEIMACTASPFP